MSETMKIPVSEMKVAKYETFIDDIDSNFKEKGVLGLTMRQRARNTALALVYDYETCNEYAKIIMNQTHLDLSTPDNVLMNPWGKYSSHDSFGNLKGKINAVKEFVQLCKQSENQKEGYKFIFWALMILTVDQTDAEEHLSLICDMANMLRITDDEFEDVIWVVKTVCTGSMPEYKFKSEIVPRIFDRVLYRYTS